MQRLLRRILSMETVRFQFVIVLLLIITLSGSSADHAESTAGFARNSTITVAPFPKATLEKNQEVIDSHGGRSAVLDAMELIDPKASEQVLELIVKIAEHPAIWKQIHRVLETLEANNAAYSQRIDATRSELGWINKRLDRPGDKRNDVPDDKIALSNVTSADVSISPLPSLETTFQRWRDVLFASTVPKESRLFHPQLKASEIKQIEESKIEPIADIDKGRYWSSPINHPEQLREEKNFEERLNEIEEELKKLTKLSRMKPLKLKQQTIRADHQQEKRVKTKTSKIFLKNAANQNQSGDDSISVTKSHPKFQYHRVHNTTNQPGPSSLLGSNFWKKIASLKHNNGSNPTSRRNSFVAVSISPPTSEKSKRDEPLIRQHQQRMLATEQLKSEFTKPCKKVRNIHKQNKLRTTDNNPSTNKK